MKKLLFKIFTLFTITGSFTLIAPRPAFAVCPVCTVAVVAGLEVSRLLGIDDIISSIWIGGLILSMSFWLVDWLNKSKFFKKIKDKKTTNLLNLLVIIIMYLLVLIPLKLNHSIGVAQNVLWGIDKIVFGITAGSVFFLLGMWADKKVRKIKGRQLFKYQKVVFPVLSLIIISLVFFFITKGQ